MCIYVQTGIKKWRTNGIPTTQNHLFRTRLKRADRYIDCCVQWSKLFENGCGVWNSGSQNDQKRTKENKWKQ